MPSADRKAVQMTPAKPRVMIYEERNRNGEQKKKKKKQLKKKKKFVLLRPRKGVQPSKNIAVIKIFISLNALIANWQLNQIKFSLNILTD